MEIEKREKALLSAKFVNRGPTNKMRDQDKVYGERNEATKCDRKTTYYQNHDILKRKDSQLKRLSNSAV